MASIGESMNHLGQLAFVDVAVVDQDGRCTSSDDQVINVEVHGDGELAAEGSGDPAPEDRYDGASSKAFDGAALVIVRRTGAGPIEVRISTSESVSDAAVTLEPVGVLRGVEDVVTEVASA